MAVDQEHRRMGVGSAVLKALLNRARELGVGRVFCLTFETHFFASHGFTVIEGTPVDPKVYEQLLRSYDVGVAEFLDLERVKPNTLGNTRMLVVLK
jgi:amino-acid N-acetyltransferase